MHPPRSARPPVRLDIRATVAVAILAFAFVGAACSPGGPSSSDPGSGTVRVVATTTVLADMVRRVGGSRVTVDSLVPAGGEVHTFDPTPSDLTRVADAELIVMNGLGLDDWLGRVAADSSTHATILRVGEGLDGVDYLGGDPDHPDEAVNPHLWLNVRYAMRYVERIAAALDAADPEHAADHAAGAQAYLAVLAELDAWVVAEISAIPEADRRIVSLHEAFPYFAAAYDLEIVGTVLNAPGQDPSAGEIAALVEAIRASGARAIFSEVQFSPQLVAAIAAETGTTVEADLYNDSLGDPPVDSYEGLIRWDVERIVAALTR